MNVKELQARLRAGLPEAIGDMRARAQEHAPEAVAQREAGYSIKNAAGDEAVVRIYDEIWWLGVNAIDLAADLDEITAPRMRVEINSPGGDVFDGIAIYNALRNHPAHVTTRVDGLAASIASVIAQAGDHRVIQPSAQMMIHNAWGMTVGDNRDHADMVALLEQQDSVIAAIYATHAPGAAEHFRDLMNAETWLTAEAAIAEGLADEILEPPAKQDGPTASSRRTLHDQISDAVDAVSEAMSSAERVDALRADAGKELSNKNRESLVGLRNRIDALLTTTPQDTTVTWSEEELERLRSRRG